MGYSPTQCCNRKEIFLFRKKDTTLSIVCKSAPAQEATTFLSYSLIFQLGANPQMNSLQFKIVNFVRMLSHWNFIKRCYHYPKLMLREYSISSIKSSVSSLVSENRLINGIFKFPFHILSYKCFKSRYLDLKKGHICWKIWTDFWICIYYFFPCSINPEWLFAISSIINFFISY